MYAELRNLIDLLVAAAYLRDQDLYAKAEWKMEILGDEKILPVATCNAPKQVPATVNVVWRNKTAMTPFGGGANRPAGGPDLREPSERRRRQAGQGPPADHPRAGQGPVVVGLSGYTSRGLK